MVKKALKDPKAKNPLSKDKSPKRLNCKFCGKPVASFAGLCGHLAACPKRFKTVLCRWTDEDVRILGNRICIEILESVLLDENFEKTYPTTKEQKAWIKGFTTLGARYGKNIVNAATFSPVHAQDEKLDGKVGIYEL